MKFLKSIGFFAIALSLFLTACEEEIEPTPEPAIQFSLSAMEATLTGRATDAEISPTVTFTNDSDAPITLRWERTETLPSGWEAATCDNVACHIPSVTVRDMEVPAAGEEGSSFPLKVTFYPNTNRGTANANIRLYDPTDSARTVQVVSFEAIAE